MKIYSIQVGKNKIRCEATTKTSATAKFAMMGYDVVYQDVQLEGVTLPKKDEKKKSPR